MELLDLLAICVMALMSTPYSCAFHCCQRSHGDLTLLRSQEGVRIMAENSTHLKRIDLYRSQSEEIEGENGRLKVVALRV